MTALALALALLAAPIPSGGAEIDVLVLTRLHPRELRFEGPRALAVAARGDTLVVDGKPAPQPLALEAGEWRVAPRGAAARRYTASFQIRARNGELRVVATLPLEEYVAGVVASETLPCTPPAALQAQAVVTRSYALAQPRRHPEASACDLAHCQVLGADVGGRHRDAAREAAEATRGQVLVLGSGEIALAPFHAACGGHTAEPAEVFPGRDRSGATAVADPGCAAPWSARVPIPALIRAASRALGGAPAEPRALRAQTGTGGFVARVVDRSSGRSATGEAFIRALGAEVGYGKVPSPRFHLSIEGDFALLRGAGKGHGVGLCQSGAARLAGQGLDYAAILERFFPRARLARRRSSQ
ncbi:MAG: SpoIID/LytB domain-containing protein [Myxococcales bacterium]|jgi:stage II sporulation protein D